jgi:hypothetical protein
VTYERWALSDGKLLRMAIMGQTLRGMFTAAHWKQKKDSYQRCMSDTQLG